MSQTIDQSHIAMLRGVGNCGNHHEEDKLSPAVQFAQECNYCAGLIFVMIYNAGIQVQLRETLSIVKARGGR